MPRALMQRHHEPRLQAAGSRQQMSSSCTHSAGGLTLPAASRFLQAAGERLLALQSCRDSPSHSYTAPLLPAATGRQPALLSRARPPLPAAAPRAAAAAVHPAWRALRKPSPCYNGWQDHAFMRHAASSGGRKACEHGANKPAQVETLARRLSVAELGCDRQTLHRWRNPLREAY